MMASDQPRAHAGVMMLPFWHQTESEPILKV
jgi:hypothetical protein